MGSKEGPPAFERVLGGFGATAISLGGIIGSGIFFIIGFASADAGPAVILSLIIAGCVAAFTALSFASLGSKIPKEGGEYQFVYMAFGPTIGFFAGLLWLFATAIGGVTASIGFASYLSALLHIGPINVIAAAICILFVLIDAMGLRFSSKVNNLLVIIKVSVLALFIALSLPAAKAPNFDGFLSKGLGGVFSGAFLIFFAYAGFGKITAAAEEVKDPQKTIPKAIIAGVAISTALYILATLGSVGAVGADKLASKDYRNAPFAHVMEDIGYPWAFSIISVGAITATASVLLIQVLGLSRTVYAMSKNDQLPSFLSELHPAFKTPYKAEIILGVMMALAAFLLEARAVIAITSLGILSYYALINLAALTMKKQKGGFEVSPLVSILGFVSSALLILYFLVVVVAGIRIL